jgi:hypothetical protein
MKFAQKGVTGPLAAQFSVKLNFIQLFINIILVLMHAQLVKILLAASAFEQPCDIRI